MSTVCCLTLAAFDTSCFFGIFLVGGSENSHSTPLILTTTYKKTLLKYFYRSLNMYSIGDFSQGPWNGTLTPVLED